MIRVVHALGGTLDGGVFNMIFNFNMPLNRDSTFIYLVMEDKVRDEIVLEIEKNGGEVFILPNFRNFFSYVCALYKFYKINHKNIDVVHVHNPNIGLLDLFFSKFFKIKIRILHSHSDKFSRKLINSLLNKFLNFWLIFFSTNKLACSVNAGLAKFNKIENFSVLLNGIDLDRYSFSNSKRLDFRTEYNLSDKILFGHVGSFVSIKNHNFIIELFHKLSLLDERFHLCLVGDGELKLDIERKVKEYGLDDRVLFLGQRKDIDKILCALDYFLFPSLFEGLGICLIEAQAMGVKCYSSNNIPQETNVTDLISYLELDIQTWIDEIMMGTPVSIDFRNDYNQRLKSTGFNVKNSSQQLLTIYKGNLSV